jgi:hypothetical protein
VLPVTVIVPPAATNFDTSAQPQMRYCRCAANTCVNWPFSRTHLTVKLTNFSYHPFFWDTHGGSGCRTRTNTEQIYHIPEMHLVSAVGIYLLLLARDKIILMGVTQALFSIFEFCADVC